MIIKVTKGRQNFEITTNSQLPYQELLKIIQQKYGIIPNIRKSINYKHNDKVIFVIDDSTLDKARNTYEKQLQLFIDTDQQKIYNNEEYPQTYYKSYNEMSGVDPDWNKDQWVEKICKSCESYKTNTNRNPPKYHPHQINSQTISEIQKNTSKVQRFGHSQDLVGSFLMSCYHQQARKKNLKEEQIDRCVWKLDRWRQQKRKALTKQQKDTVEELPILLLPPQKKQKYKKNPKPSYIFGNNTKNQVVIVDPQDEKNPNKAVLLSSQDDDQNYVKYYLLDQTHFHLSKFSAGQTKKQQLKNFISKLPASRDFTDTDLNFVTTVFQAYVQYSAGGNIYHPPLNPQSGMLIEFDDNEVIGILGDWGTAEVDANYLLDELVNKEKASIILHLGDVYYAGFPQEFKKISDKINQLQQQKPNLRYYTVPGNHDYYTFGGPFYQHITKNHLRKEYNQRESFFCLRNKSHTVQFIGLNTGKNEHSMTNPLDFLFEGTFLEKSQAKWAIDKILNFPGKTILLTHHMFFSSFQKILGAASQFGFKNPQVNNLLAQQLFQIFPKITCWIWGHQHRFSTFIKNSYGINRCILFGNSAFQNNEENYYEVKYPADNITDSTFHPPRDNGGYFSHTAMILNNFNNYKISAKYLYTTSSFNQPSSRIKELYDQISQPQQLQITYKSTFQMIQSSGLSLQFDNLITLGSAPANLQILNAQNTNAEGSINLNKNVLIRLQNSPYYLYYGMFGFVDHGDYQSESENDKKKYLWKIKRENQSNAALKTGDIFKLQNVFKGKLIGRQSHLGNIRLSAPSKSSRFFLYLRETTHIPPKAQPQKSKFFCCNVM